MVHLYARFKVRLDEVTTRSYRAGDVEAMWALDITCFEPVFRFSRQAMRGFAESRGALTVLAEFDDELIGFCIAQMEDQIAYVVTLDVAPAWRRQGLARRLMDELEHKAGGAGAVAMALHVFSGNTGAMRFYEKLGYDRIGMERGFYGRGLDALLYRKEVEAHKKRKVDQRS
jgi:[ribosomal protein S18]-alanine N-acetyltransferase